MSEIQLPKIPERCLCGRIPTVSKGRGGYILTCPAWQACKYAPNGGRYRDLGQAVEGWNFIIDRLHKKGATK